MSDPAKRVVIVGCRNRDDAAADDLYPDEDRAVLVEAFTSAGFETTVASWDDKDVDWASFDAAVIRSTWDSVDRPTEYLNWAQATDKVTALVNPLAVVAWNIDKVYLRDLSAAAVPVVPTIWVTDESQWRVPAGEFVVKPSISAGGRETARYQPDEADAAGAHVGRLLALGHTVMVQPYVASVDRAGETRLVFLDGKYSHATRVGALLEPGAGVIERPWEKVVNIETVEPSPEQVTVADRVLDATAALAGARPVHARVDLVTGPDGNPRLSEVELIDPVLGLHRAPGSAERLAAAVARHIRGRTAGPER